MITVDTWLKSYEQKLYAYFKKHVKIDSVCKDFTQDILIKMWIKRADLIHQDNADRYIFTMARNHIVDHLRKAKLDLSYREQLKLEMFVQKPQVLQKFISTDTENLLAQLLHDLPPRQREIVELSRLKGYSHEEIANQLNISNKTVRNHLFEALKTLRQKVNTEAIPLLLFLFSSLG